MLQSIKMKDFMSSYPITFNPDTSIHDAVAVLLKNRLSGGTVIDHDNRVVGVISEMDMLKAVEEISYYNQGSGQVGDYMTKEVIVIEEDMNIFDMANKMLKHKLRRFPVVKNGLFVGQISARSILQAMKDSLD